MKSFAFFIGLLFFSGMSHAEWYSFRDTPETSPHAQAAPAHIRMLPAKSQLVVDVRVDGMERETQSTRAGLFEELSFGGQGYANEIGLPKVPVIRKLIEIASDQASLRILATTSLKSLGHLQHDLLPVQAPVAKIPGAWEAAPFAMNAAAYAQNQFYPRDVARVISVGSFRGHRVALIEIHPLQYNPAQKTFRALRHIRLQVKPGPHVVENISPLKEFDLLGSQSILNYQIPAGTTQPKLLVVVGHGFEQSAKLAEYINWKKEKGFAVQVENVADIGTSPEVLRAEVKKVYRQSQSGNPLAYVLLVGDIDLIPAYNQQGATQYTDDYYAAIDKDDYEADKIYPDLAVGRLTVNKPEELDIVLDKLLRYGRGEFKDFAWIKKIAFLATDDRYTVAEATHNYAIDTYTIPAKYTGIFPANPELGADKLYAITNHATEADVMNSLNDGRVMVTYSGHGATTYWAGPHLSIEDVQNLNPGDALPYVTSHACLAGSYGIAGGGFGQAWLKAPHGAIGFWGTTNLSYWDEDDALERSFYDGVFKANLKTVGLANLAGLQGVRERFGVVGRTPYYFEIYNLQGDPTVELWRQKPGAPVDSGAAL